MRAFDLLVAVDEKTPDDVKVTETLAALYDRQGNREQSCKLYARALTLGNKGLGDSAPVTAINYGTCLATEGRLEQAMQLWSGAVKNDPGNEAARLNLAVAQFRSGRRGARESQGSIALQPRLKARARVTRGYGSGAVIFACSG